MRLRIEHSGFSTLNNQRFGSKFVGDVANPTDMLLFSKKQTLEQAEAKKIKDKGASSSTNCLLSRLTRTRTRKLTSRTSSATFCTCPSESLSSSPRSPWQLPSITLSPTTRPAPLRPPSNQPLLRTRRISWDSQLPHCSGRNADYYQKIINVQRAGQCCGFGPPLRCTPFIPCDGTGRKPRVAAQFVQRLLSAGNRDE